MPQHQADLKVEARVVADAAVPTPGTPHTRASRSILHTSIMAATDCRLRHVAEKAREAAERDQRGADLDGDFFSSLSLGRLSASLQVQRCG